MASWGSRQCGQEHPSPDSQHPATIQFSDRSERKWPPLPTVERILQSRLTGTPTCVSGWDKQPYPFSLS